MFGVGYQDLLILLVILGFVILMVMLMKGKKLTSVAAGLGFLQGLVDLVFGFIGGPPEFHPENEIERNVAVFLMKFQGLLMLIFSVATYKSKLWGAYGLCAIGFLYVLLQISSSGTPGWVLPLLIYLLAAIALHRDRRAARRADDAKLT